MNGPPPDSSSGLRPSRLAPTDLLRVGVEGLRGQKLRAGLSGLGVAIGIAAMVAILGISASSRQDLSNRLGRFGNLLTAGTGQSLTGQATPLPDTARTMITRIPPVRAVAGIGVVAGATVRRTAAIPDTDTGGIAVVAADDNLRDTIDATVDHGAFLNPATATEPVVVLGAAAARYLGVLDAATGRQVDINGRLFAVAGILAPVEIAPEIDQTALIGFGAARTTLQFDGTTTRLYVRADPDQVPGVRSVLARTANPAQPEAVSVSRASDLLAARSATNQTFDALYLGLGAVAILVGGIGIANVMAIAVLERRSEIGLRRALGATRTQIASQFLTEATTLAALGGAAGAAAGLAAAGITARLQQWPPTLPQASLWGAVAISIGVGMLAGVFPARRAATVPPSQALRSA